MRGRRMMQASAAADNLNAKNFRQGKIFDGVSIARIAIRRVA
jgi:hypothetical protein